MVGMGIVAETVKNMKTPPTTCIVGRAINRFDDDDKVAITIALDTGVSIEKILLGIKPVVSFELGSTSMWRRHLREGCGCFG